MAWLVSPLQAARTMRTRYERQQAYRLQKDREKVNALPRRLTSLLKRPASTCPGGTTPLNILDGLDVQSGPLPAANLNWPFWIAHNEQARLGLTGDFPVHRDRMGAARRPARTMTQAFGIQLKFGDGTAEGVAVHAQLARGLALITLAFLQHRENESLLEFAHAFGISYAVFVHLQDQSFQLIFHNASLFCFGKAANGPQLHR